MLTKATMEGFGKLLRGELIFSDDKRYDEARKVWNGMIDRRPAAIARCVDASDVSAAVKFGRDHDLPIAIRGGGHNVAGFGTCDDGIVIDLSPMKGISVDPTKRVAQAQGGLTWGEFDKRTQEQGLATTGGLVMATGIAGFTLGGGIGWLMRKHGLTIDNLLSVDMVDADGNRVTASENENPDLFWGVRGGGGNFGVVTSFTYRLHNVGPTVYGGALFYPLSKAKDLLRFYREWVHTVPDELTSMIAFITAPPAPFMPHHLQGTPMIAIALCYVGPVENGDALVNPIRLTAPPAVDIAGPIPYTTLQGMFDESVPKGIFSYWKTEYLRKLDDSTVETMIEHVRGMGVPFSQVHIHHVEGAVKRVDSKATSFGHRDAPFILNIVGLWNNSDETNRHIAWAREFSRAIQPYATGSPYINFLGDEGEVRTKAAYGEEKFARLVNLKNKYDPKNVFRINQNIRPTI